MLTHIIAKHCGLVADEFVYFLCNAHIYEEHVEPLKEQIERLPYEFPQITINKIHDSVEILYANRISTRTLPQKRSLLNILCIAE